jgi:hypothetical protein
LAFDQHLPCPAPPLDRHRLLGDVYRLISN